MGIVEIHAYRREGPVVPALAQTHGAPLHLQLRQRARHVHDQVHAATPVVVGDGGGGKEGQGGGDDEIKWVVDREESMRSSDMSPRYCDHGRRVLVGDLAHAVEGGKHVRGEVPREGVHQSTQVDVSHQVVRAKVVGSAQAIRAIENTRHDVENTAEQGEIYN